MGDEPDTEQPVDEYWHFRWTAFVFACLACLALFGGLVLTRHVAPIETAASVGDYMVLACGFFLSVVGVKGETWNSSGTTWLGRLTWAGRMMLLGLLFTLSVTIYQKLEIDAARTAEQAVKDEADEKRRNKRVEILQTQVASTGKQLKQLLDDAKKKLVEDNTNTRDIINHNDSNNQQSLKDIKEGVEGCPTGVQGRLKPLLDALTSDMALSSKISHELLARIQKMEDRTNELTETRTKLAATQKAIEDCRAQHQISGQLLARNWVGHWAHGNWFTKGEFERIDAQRLRFQAATTFETIARKEQAQQSVELMQWEGEPFACDGSSGEVAFPIKRTILATAQAVDENLTEQSITSTMRLRLARALIADYGGNDEKARLVMYEAFDGEVSPPPNDH